MANQKISQLTPAPALNDSDVLPLVQSGANKKATTQALRAAIAGIQGTWDVTGATSSATPIALDGVVVAPIVGGSPNRFHGTFIAGAAGVLKAAKSGRIEPSGDQRWAKFVSFGEIGGDNSQNIGLIISNADATQADINATVVGLPTFVGSCTSLAICIEQEGYCVGLIATATGGIVGYFPIATVTDGTDIFVGVDFSTGEYLRQIGAGPVEAVSDASALAAVSVAFVGFFGAEPPVLAAQPLEFSLGSSEGGRTPFQATGDAVAPVGAADGKKYLVQNAGRFNNKVLADGDVAEFRNNTADVFVIQGNPLVAADVAVIATAAVVAALPPALDPLGVSKALAHGMLNYPHSDAPYGTPVEGDLVIVADAPFGAFFGFTAGNVALFLGGAWRELNHVATLGYEFTLSFDGGAPSHTAKRLDVALPGGPEEGYYSQEGVQTFNGVSETALRTQGWVVSPVFPGTGAARKRKQVFSGSSSANIEQGTADYFDVTIDQDFTLFAGIGAGFASVGYIRVTNAAAGPITLYLGTGSYPMAATQSLFFVCIGDIDTGVQFTAPLIP